jgi:hypothetical protein
MPNNLSDMDFDEVSFVRRGANQKAHVVLFKSGDPYPLEDAVEMLRDAEPGLTHAQAITKVYQSCQELYAESVQPRNASVAKANPQLEEIAKSIQQRDEGTRAQAVLKALESDPELYQG